MSRRGSCARSCGHARAATAAHRTLIGPRDGAAITFDNLANPNALNDEIWMMGPDGSHLRQLTHSHDVLYPTWSADSQKIAFQRNPDGLLGAAAIYTINANGKNERRLTK
jgi:Tol biopolymer transport system component